MRRSWLIVAAIFRGALASIGVIAVLLLTRHEGAAVEMQRAETFVALVATNLGLLVTSRRGRWHPALGIAVAATLGALALVLFWPVLRERFSFAQLEPLAILRDALVAAAPLLLFVLVRACRPSQNSRTAQS